VILVRWCYSTRKISADASGKNHEENPAGSKNSVEKNLPPGESERVVNYGKARSGSNAKPAVSGQYRIWWGW
jgi:hypothetical protein